MHIGWFRYIISNKGIKDYAIHFNHLFKEVFHIVFDTSYEKKLVNHYG